MVLVGDEKPLQPNFKSAGMPAKNRLAWASDVHLNFPTWGTRKQFYQSFKDCNATAILITGDIAEAQNVDKYINEVKEETNLPTYFVLGNHDFYNGSVKVVQNLFKKETGYLGNGGIVRLSGKACLIGADGFYDGELGNFKTSRLEMTDFFAIKELAMPIRIKEELRNRIRQLGKIEANKAEKVLKEALTYYDEVHFATHVPPFKEATWHRGEHSNDEWLPFFSSKFMGNVLMKMAQAYPKKSIKVYCGHTHGDGVFQPLDNLVVSTASARYGHPQIYKLIEA